MNEADKHGSAELHLGEERFHQVFASSPLGMYIQTDGLFRHLNPAALALFGTDSAAQLLGQSFIDRIHPNSRVAVNERARLVIEKQKVAPFLEEQYFRLNGTVVDVEVTAMPLDFEGRIGAMVLVHDITSRKEEEDKRRALEQQLFQAQKMEMVGRLAGGVAHDFNNLLMVIQSHTELLQNSLPMHDRLRSNTEQVLNAADRGVGLTRQLLAFGRRQFFSPLVIDLNLAVSDSTKMLGRLLGEDIEFRVNLAESLWPIKADPDQIVQVLLNLCMNARHAMPQGGVLTIATGNIAVEEGFNGKRSNVTPGDYVTLSVTDTGMGIKRDLQEEIFEPFLPTSEGSKGTGLELATAYGIVKQSGGYMWVDSDPGGGACFTIYLPSLAGKGREMSTEIEARPRGTETLFVVEGKEAQRKAMCEYLHSLGYTVFAAPSGHQAISVVCEHKVHVDLLITDVETPKMSGRELSRMLGKLCPGLRTIYMSAGIHWMAATSLQKPFSLGTLARKVRDKLGSDRT